MSSIQTSIFLRSLSLPSTVKISFSTELSEMSFLIILTLSFLLKLPVFFSLLEFLINSTNHWTGDLSCHKIYILISCCTIQTFCFKCPPLHLKHLKKKIIFFHIGSFSIFLNISSSIRLV